MKTWTTPVMQELDVRLTASSGVKGTTEQAGFLDGNDWVTPTYDSAVYEYNEVSHCTFKKGEVES